MSAQGGNASSWSCRDCGLLIGAPLDGSPMPTYRPCGGEEYLTAAVFAGRVSPFEAMIGAHECKGAVWKKPAEQPRGFHASCMFEEIDGATHLTRIAVVPTSEVLRFEHEQYRHVAIVVARSFGRQGFDVSEDSEPGRQPGERVFYVWIVRPRVKP